MVETNGELIKLQNLVRSSLLEINKLKMDVIKLEEKNNILRNQKISEDFKEDLEEKLRIKDEEINQITANFEEELSLEKDNSSNMKLELEGSLNNKNIEIDNLRSSLISKNTEIDNLKSSLNKNISSLNDFKENLAFKDVQIKDQESKISELSNKVLELTDLNESLSTMKESFDRELNNFKTLELGEVNLKLKNALNDVAAKENEIQSTHNDLKIANNEINSLKRDLNDFKSVELHEVNIKLNNALNDVENKNREIQSLNSKIESQRETINDLKNNLVTKDSITALQREIDSRDGIIREKDVQIKVLKDKSVSKEEFSKIKNELSKKDLQVKRLNEVKDLFFELSDDNILSSDLKEDVINRTSVDDKSLLELNELKKELEIAKNNKIKFKAIGSEINNDSLLNSEENNKSSEVSENNKDSVVNSELSENNKDSVVNSKEIAIDESENKDAVSNNDIETLKNELKEYKNSLKELEKIKDVYEKLTAPQMKNLTSIQSQIYHLLPEKPLDTLAIQNYVNDVAFENLSFGNTKNILKSLERKGYAEIDEVKDDIIYWKKIIK